MADSRRDAREAYAASKSTQGRDVIGWKLGRDERDQLLERFPATYADAVADHVTLAAHVGNEAPLPCETSGEIIGISDDGNGVEAMVVRIGGTAERPDGKTYHITWSLDRSKGRKPVESNDVIARLGWRDLDAPVPIRLNPARF